MSEILSAKKFRETDPQVKDLAWDKYAHLASNETIMKTKKSLETKGHVVTVVNNAGEALEAIRKLIPDGASVMNAGSTTLQEIGYVDYLKKQTKWKNLHGEILNEPDHVKQSEMRRKAMCADYFLSSCSAISEAGDITVCDASGSRTGAFNFSAGKVVVIAGSNKIVPTYDDAVKRTEQFCLPLESARARIVYKVPGSAINFFVALRSGNPYGPGRVHVILVTECLGY